MVRVVVPLIGRPLEFVGDERYGLDLKGWDELRSA